MESSNVGRGSGCWIAALLNVLIICVSCLLLSTPVIAQQLQQVEHPAAGSEQEVTTPQPKTADQSEQKLATGQPETQTNRSGKKKDGKLEGIVVAPLPISSPAIGSGIIPVLGYIF